ncbi:MAG: Aromatic-amino-acid aminotransferase 2 [Candidatus Argoarchaeum ethanivorans]|uniref:Aminotransferase n=1 Tax=Candidatus Argoarchaeum ethanivorans TaxID=2608793 RepID=A0A811TBQ6_9EURY|nr:MAG: Aromatic-amino-acid aminotransferase 2 [Candidatus Argoarchaeum ethanivorans]
MHSTKISRIVQSVPPSGIRRFFDLVTGRDDIISLGVGEPDFVTPWHIRETCIYSLEKGYTSYTPNQGLIELRELICEDFYRNYHLSYQSDEALITTGVSEAADLALRAVINQGEEVLVPEPSYVSYKPCVSFAGGKPIPIETFREDKFRLIPEQIKKHVTPDTKAIILSYPNNPTGAIMERKHLEEIADAIIEHDLLIISDEVYSKLTYNNNHTTIAELNGMQERTIILNGFSKSYAMTGLRIGYALAPMELLSALAKIHQYTMLCAPVTAQMGAIEAMKKGEEEMQKMKKEYNHRRRIFVKRLNDIGLDCFEPQGAFYTFPSIQTTGLNSEQFAEQLLKEQKVAAVPGSVFGRSGEGHIRFSYATSLEELKIALERIEEFLNR